MESNQPTADRPLYLGFWLRHVANHVARAFAYKLKDHDVTVAECTAVRQLFSVETMAPSRLAARTGMTHDEIIKLTDRLIARSLVAWTDHAQDGWLTDAVSDARSAHPRAGSSGAGRCERR